MYETFIDILQILLRQWFSTFFLIVAQRIGFDRPLEKKFSELNQTLFELVSSGVGRLSERGFTHGWFCLPNSGLTNQAYRCIVILGHCSIAPLTAPAIFFASLRGPIPHWGGDIAQFENYWSRSTYADELKVTTFWHDIPPKTWKKLIYVADALKPTIVWYIVAIYQTMTVYNRKQLISKTTMIWYGHWLQARLSTGSTYASYRVRTWFDVSNRETDMDWTDELDLAKGDFLLTTK